MTNPVIAATQFTAFMAMTNIAISMANYRQGVVAERVGFATLLYIDALLILLSLIVIPFLRTRDEDLRIKTSQLHRINKPEFATGD